jgi:hypothetical protein
MGHPKLSALLLALTFGAALTAGGQTIIQTLPPDNSQAVQGAVIVSPAPAIVVESEPAAVVRVAPVPIPDPKADTQCRMLPASGYSDCVNSHNGG